MSKNKIILFSEFSEMCKVLNRELAIYNPVMIIGETPTEKRQPLLDRFNSDPECKICIMSSAGTYGLNITSANIVIHYDQAWSLAKMIQRVGRAHRIGQKQVVLVYNLLAKGTIDSYCKRVLLNKQKLSDDILDTRPISIEDMKNALLYED